MSSALLTVEQAAQQLRLHVKTVLRYIREGRLPATRVGKSYRIEKARLDSFAGIVGNAVAGDARATCIVDLSGVTPEEAQSISSFLQSAAIAGSHGDAPLHLETAHDPLSRSLKLVVIGSPGRTAAVLQILELKLGRG